MCGGVVSETAGHHATVVLVFINDGDDGRGFAGDFVDDGSFGTNDQRHLEGEGGSGERSGGAEGNVMTKKGNK